MLVESQEDRVASTLDRRITIFREVGGHYRRSEENHRVRLFDAGLLEDLLSSAGFAVTQSDRYGGYRLATRRRAFVARKR